MSAELADKLELARWDMAALERESWPSPRSRPPPCRAPAQDLAPVTAEQGRRNRVALLEAAVGLPWDDEPAAPPAAAARRSA